MILLEIRLQSQIMHQCEFRCLPFMDFWRGWSQILDFPVDFRRLLYNADAIRRWLQLRFDFDSTPVRRPFDCLSEVIKVTVT